MIVIQLYLLGLISLLLTFSLGYLSLRSITNLTVKESLALAGGWGCALQGLIAFLGFTLGLSSRLFFLAMSGGLLAIFIILIISKNFLKYPQITLSKSASILTTVFANKEMTKLISPCFYFNFSTINFSAYLLLIYWLTLVSIQLCIPIYSGSDWYGDWWMHYDIAQFYLGEKSGNIIYFDYFDYFDGYTVTSRTPLFNLFASYHLGLWGDKFSVYQLVAILPGIFFLTTIPLFLKSKRIILAMILMAINPYVNHMTIFPWPKILTSVYIIAGIYFYLEIRKKTELYFFTSTGVYCGIALGLAILGHPSALIYVVAIVIDSLWLNRGRILMVIRQLILPLSSAFAVVLPWVLWGVSRYGLSEFFYNSAKTTGHSTLTVRFIDALKNAIYTLEPHRLLNQLFNIDPARTKIGIWDSWLLLYYDVLPGTLTLTMAALLTVTAFYRNSRKISLQSVLPNSFFIILVTVGFWGGCILQPGSNPGGIVGESMTPIFFFLVLVIAEYLHTLSMNLRRFLLLLSFGEFLLSFGLHMGFMAMDNPIVWNSNLNLKFDNNLFFARDLTETGLPIFLGAIGFLVLLGIGLRIMNIEGTENRETEVRS